MLTQIPTPQRSQAKLFEFSWKLSSSLQLMRSCLFRVWCLRTVVSLVRNKHWAWLIKKSWIGVFDLDAGMDSLDTFVVFHCGVVRLNHLGVTNWHQVYDVYNHPRQAPSPEVLACMGHNHARASLADPQSCPMQCLHQAPLQAWGHAWTLDPIYAPTIQEFWGLCQLWPPRHCGYRERRFHQWTAIYVCKCAGAKPVIPWPTVEDTDEAE